MQLGYWQTYPVNLTVSGAEPDVELTMNEVTGRITRAVTLMKVTCLEILYPAPLLAFSTIE